MRIVIETTANQVKFWPRPDGGKYVPTIPEKSSANKVNFVNTTSLFKFEE